MRTKMLAIFHDGSDWRLAEVTVVQEVVDIVYGTVSHYRIITKNNLKSWPFWPNHRNRLEVVKEHIFGLHDEDVAKKALFKTLLAQPPRDRNTLRTPI